MGVVTTPRITSTCRHSAAPTSTKARLFAGTWFARAWLGGLMGRLAAGVSRAAINRRVVGQLSRMSDRELRDIGLVRQDVLDSEMLLLEGDASSFLVGRRNERWGARRRSLRRARTRWRVEPMARRDLGFCAARSFPGALPERGRRVS